MGNNKSNVSHGVRVPFFNQMKPKTIFRILSIALALSMLTAYVVYSQKQQVQRAAPSSKVIVLAPGREHSFSTNTNAISVTNVAVFNPDVLAFSSKSAAPLVKIPITPATNVSAEKTTRIAPSSKSAPVFDWSAPVFDWTPPKQKITNTNVRPLKTNQVKSTRR